MDSKDIIMSFTSAPSPDDLEVIAQGALDQLPEELMSFCEELTVQIEEFPDEVTENDMDLDDPYELLALYKSGNEISPGVQSKNPQSEDSLTLFRRPILDLWCETGDDLGALVRQVMIEEIARQHDYSDSEIEDLLEQHYQGLL